MNAQDATQLTNDFKNALLWLVLMERSDRVFTAEDVRKQRERVALLEASIRTALLHSA